jgi:fructose-1,6-bisphosphatase/inositol monophosphatase family enzyme
MNLTTLELSCLQDFRQGAGCWPAVGQPLNNDAWIQFALAATLHASTVVRALRVAPLSSEAVFKADASPVTAQEHEIEWMIRGRLAEFCPDAVVVGEESGGELPKRGLAVAVDPVDGTWALLNRMATYSVVLAVFQDGAPVLGMVGNPATGEIAYAINNQPTRLLQIGLFGESDHAAELPLDRVTPDNILVNVHPSRHVGPVIGHCLAGWNDGTFRMVRMEGGSPSAALLEAAKGAFVYVNLWDKRAAEPFDLAAGMLLVRNAGGDILDMHGKPIDSASHAGPFVAAADPDQARAVLDQLEAQIHEASESQQGDEDNT